MALHRMVDGKKVFLSAEEEQALRDQWAAEDARQAKEVYKEMRCCEYPTVPEQLDMLWHELNISGQIDAAGIWFNTIKAIKDKYPKPGA